MNELFWACHKGDLNKVKSLIEDGADIHEHCERCLAYACAKGHLDVVKLLLSQNADLHAKNDRALTMACEEGRDEVVEYLLQQGAKNADASFLATTLGHLSTTKLLLKYNCMSKEDVEEAIRFCSVIPHCSEIVKYLNHRND